MKKLLTALFVLFVFCFMSGAALACDSNCDCGCQQGKECSCKKEAKCDCNCDKTGECDCKDKCKCGCSKDKCKCKKAKKFKLFRKKQIKCNCEQ